ncbi:MAG: GNAT family N-acetyltransferase [Treponema sp.]|jgi:Leu/Phe-tRNA-protein transferase|nr:GNAT family N-acetyltransferase [Treponema sp.]
MYLHYTSDGYLLIFPEDNIHRVVDAMLATGYNEEFCIALDFSPGFVARLMEAGFLVMSAEVFDKDEGKSVCVLLPKLHLIRSALFFENLHIKRSIRRFLPRYELRPDEDFDRILDRCVQVHGAEWLTPPLVESIRKIRENTGRMAACGPTKTAHPVSFALYREGKLVAGEFGVVAGRVYTSYSGYYDEDNAGTVQLILTTRYLQTRNFAFFDLGMPLDYKTNLGAVDISPEEFVAIFRSKPGRYVSGL